MGFFDEILKWIKAIAELKKADAEQTKAKNQKNRIKKLNRENRALKKNLSKNYKIAIIGIGITSFGIIVPIILWYFSVSNIP